MVRAQTCPSRTPISLAQLGKPGLLICVCSGWFMLSFRNLKQEAFCLWQLFRARNMFSSRADKRLQAPTNQTQLLEARKVAFQLLWDCFELRGPCRF